jgi:LAO/AO transport system kinase
VDELLERVRQGNGRAIARLITQVENSVEVAGRAASALHAYSGDAHLVGITGPPGCGKSTLVNEVAKRIHDSGKRVGIIAVDPSSPFTGGALLGDRVRMADISTREGIFVRSMASRGTLGGLAAATSAVTKILDAAGFEMIIVETIGAGQAEVDIASIAHTILVIEAPGSGDGVQSIKAGILEIADILVVNKADRPGVENSVRALEAMLQFSRTSYSQNEPDSDHHSIGLTDDELMTVADDASLASGWAVPVLQTIAVDGTGIDKLVAVINEHLAFLRQSGEWQRREFERSRREIERLVEYRILSQLREAVSEDQRDALVTAVARRELDPYTAADALFNLARNGIDRE